MKFVDFKDFKNSWALVTGASSGIGMEFSKQLGEHGMNIVLVARREDKLLTLAHSLEETYKIKTLSLAVDITLPEALDTIEKKLKEHGIVVRLLCNNAGNGFWGKFENCDEASYQKTILLNVSAPVLFSKRFIPSLLVYPTSVIINVTSEAAFQPLPFMSVYSATKSFLYNWSLALFKEYEHTSLYVQTLIPGPTLTEFSKHSGGGHIFADKKIKPDVIVSRSIMAIAHSTPVVSLNTFSNYFKRALGAVMPVRTILQAVYKVLKP